MRAQLRSYFQTHNVQGQATLVPCAISPPQRQNSSEHLKQMIVRAQEEQLARIQEQRKEEERKRAQMELLTQQLLEHHDMELQRQELSRQRELELRMARVQEAYRSTRLSYAQLTANQFDADPAPLAVAQAPEPVPLMEASLPLPPPRLYEDSPIYVFVDWSNISISAKRQMATGLTDPSVHVDVDKLVQLVENGRLCKARKLAGSSVRGVKDALMGESVWQLWRNNGYELHLQQRSQGTEHSVDEVLQACIADYLLEDLGGKKATLVLLTGDGNKEKNTTSFPRLAAFAARTGWTVEVWSWQCSLSKAYITLANQYQSQDQSPVSINFLDPFRSDITFIRSVTDPSKDDPYAHFVEQQKAQLQQQAQPPLQQITYNTNSF